MPAMARVTQVLAHGADGGVPAHGAALMRPTLATLAGGLTAGAEAADAYASMPRWPSLEQTLSSLPSFPTSCRSRSKTPGVRTAQDEVVDLRRRIRPKPTRLVPNRARLAGSGTEDPSSGLKATSRTRLPPWGIVWFGKPNTSNCRKLSPAINGEFSWMFVAGSICTFRIRDAVWSVILMVLEAKKVLATEALKVTFVEVMSNIRPGLSKYVRTNERWPAR